MRAILLASVMLIPTIALADPTQVPAIQTAAVASASATVTAPAPPPPSGAGLPAGMPPPVRTLSPSAPLNAKEKASATIAAAWRNHPDRPVRGEDGVLRWPFGASLPSVVCSPLQVCDLALQPNEVVNSIHVGDKVRWTILPAVSGTGSARTTHLIVKPSDSGLVSSITVYTDLRVYSVKLISTQSQWTPLTAFTYPEAAQAAWENYGASIGGSPQGSYASTTPPGGEVNLDYSVSGSASWKPTHVYSVGGKTIVIFPSEMQFSTAPAVVGLANDGGWFSSPSEQMLRYRISGQKWTIDGLPEHFALVAGVGGSQQKIDVKRIH